MMRKQFWCEDLFPSKKTDFWCEELSPTKSKISTSEHTCFWCATSLASEQVTKDHLIPRGMGTDGKTVPCCYECNQERGKVTELYSDRFHMLKYIERKPDRITTYKNRFRSKVLSLLPKVVKWEFLHREKGIVLPYNMLEVIRLDEPMPAMNSQE